MVSPIWSVAPFLICLSLTRQQQSSLPTLPTLLKNATSASEYTTLLTVQHPDLLDILATTPDTTLLIPTDDAFAKIPYSALGAPFLSNNSDVIRSVLEYHILAGRYPVDGFNGTFRFVPTWLRNTNLELVDGGQVVGGVQQSEGVNIFISGLGSRATVNKSDIAFDNGLVQLVDTFLIPPAPLLDTASQFNVTAFAGGISHAPFNDSAAQTKDLTVFAPSNAAFEGIGATLQNLSDDALTKLLGYHIINATDFVGYTPSLTNGTTFRTMQGGNLTVTKESNSLFVNSARILQSDILLKNGVMHVIDNVLSPNATGAVPNPSAKSQAPVIQGSALSGGALPFTQYLPGSAASTASSAMPTDGSASSTFGVSQIGASATTNAVSSGMGVSATSTTSGTAATSSSPTAKGKTGSAARSSGGTTGGFIGFLGLMFGLL